MKKLFLCTILITFLTSCSPSDSQITTAIALTQLSKPSETPIPFTATPTPTVTISPSSTPIITQTPTPDIRIIDIDPQKILLKPEDLPLEGKYYLPNSTWISPHTNSEVISGWTVEKGREYVITTGRIDGWWVYYARGTRAVAMPEEVFCNIVRFKDASGAQMAVTEYSYQKRYPLEGWKQLDQQFDLGDVNRIEYLSEITSGGDKLVNYYLNYSHRNFMVVVAGYGLESDVNINFLVDAGKVILKKLEEAPLSEPSNVNTGN